MNFPYIRHYQRYEYALRKGYVTDKITLDIGCGTTVYGSMVLSELAREVYAIDPKLVVGPEGKVWGYTTNHSKPGLVRCIITTIENVILDGPPDNVVCICSEVFEHHKEPKKLLEKLCSLGNYAFITTPLAAVTGKTRNATHEAEYSNEDFRNILERFYNIEEMTFQHGDLRITDTAEPNGDSLEPSHVIQMAWCKRK